MALLKFFNFIRFNIELFNSAEMETYESLKGLLLVWYKGTDVAYSVFGLWFFLLRMSVSSTKQTN